MTTSEKMTMKNLNGKNMSQYIDKNGRATTKFEFHAHTHIGSPLDGFSSPEEYLQRCDELGYKGFGITEHGTEYSWVYFDQIKDKYETKMVYGVEFYETDDITVKDKDSRYFHLVVLARNERGRIALNKLVTKSNFEGFYYKPRIELKDIAEYADDLIVSSACLGSRIARSNSFKEQLEMVKMYKSLFPNYYLEMQTHIHEDQAKYNNTILQLSEATDTPFVITSDAHSATEEDLEYQGWHVQIAQDRDTLGEIYEGCYIQTIDEIYEKMIPQVGEDNVTKGLLETLNVLDLIEEVNMPFQEPKMPTFDVPVPFMNENEYMMSQLEIGLKKRGILDYPNLQEYRDRTKMEMGVIASMEYEGYFLITQDFLDYARSKNVEIGDSRGSAGGSLVSFLMEITNIDPIKYGLVFERFLNPERYGLPDIDSDVGDRQVVIEYLEEKYGRKSVCQVSNFTYLTDKMAVKDVAKAIGIPYKFSEQITPYFDDGSVQDSYNKNKKAIDNVIKQAKFNQQNNQRVDTSLFDRLIEIASKISGRVRQTSIHACALGIVDEEITDYMAMHMSVDDDGFEQQVIQVDKRMLEEIGIVKMDILGIKTLNVVGETLKLIGKNSSYIDTNDERVVSDSKMYDLISSGNTDGIFQVESYGMKELCKRIRPDNVGDISAILALYRPDTMSVLESYIARKNGREKITYIHDDFIPILGETYGLQIYQEQTLGIVRKFGGRSYGKADMFRRAIGKKDPEKVKKESEKLYQEIIDTGYLKQLAKTISDDLATKGGYEFNKSHSYGYAMLTIKTAFLKAHHPVEFMTALMNSKIGDNARLGKYITSCKEMGIQVSPPNINKSERMFTPDVDKILFGILMIKGVGDTSTDAILEERLNGKFKSLDNFLDRVKLDKGTKVALAKSGAFGKNKRKVLQNVFEHGMMDTINEIESKEYKTVISPPTIKKLEEDWGIVADNKAERVRLYNIEKEKKFYSDQKQKAIDKRESEKIIFIDKYMQNEEKWEFEALNMYLTYNPFEKAIEIIGSFDKKSDGKNVTCAGTIIDIDKKKDRNKNTYAFVDFFNGERNIELIFWSNQYSQYQKGIFKGCDMVIKGRKEGDTIVVDKVKPFKKWKEQKGA